MNYHLPYPRAGTTLSLCRPDSLHEPVIPIPVPIFCDFPAHLFVPVPLFFIHPPLFFSLFSASLRLHPVLLFQPVTPSTLLVGGEGSRATKRKKGGVGVEALPFVFGFLHRFFRQFFSHGNRPAPGYLAGLMTFPHAPLSPEPAQAACGPLFPRSMARTSASHASVRRMENDPSHLGKGHRPWGLIPPCRNLVTFTAWKGPAGNAFSAEVRD